MKQKIEQNTNFAETNEINKVASFKKEHSK